MDTTFNVNTSFDSPFMEEDNVFQSAEYLAPISVPAYPEPEDISDREEFQIPEFLVQPVQDQKSPLDPAAYIAGPGMIYPDWLNFWNIFDRREEEYNQEKEQAAVAGFNMAGLKSYWPLAALAGAIFYTLK